MTEMLVYDCLVTICCRKLKHLLVVCMAAYADTPNNLRFQVRRGGRTLFIGITHCSFCGKRIVVSQVEEK